MDDGFTVIWAVAEAPPALAVIVVLPGETPVTVPEASTVATPGAEEEKLAELDVPVTVAVRVT